MYPALYSLCVILIYWDTAGRIAVEQEVDVLIVGLKAAALAFGVVLVPNLYMAPIRMERELKAEAERWLAQLNTQIRRNEKLTEAAEDESLSAEARELLVEAADDPNGSVDLVPTKTAFDIQTNGKSFGNHEDPREQARWKAALDELLNRRFLEQVYGMDFKVTDSGYKMAETLTEGD